MHKQGDIVLVPFPFTDLSGDKVRPALVLGKKENGDDITLCFISSIKPKKVLPNELFVRAESKNFRTTGLKVSSLIKVAKIATLQKQAVLGTLGSIGSEDFSRVKAIIKNHFGL